MSISARHEAGHVVAAAAVGLRLRSEGVMIDTDAAGLGCYCKQPDDSDLSRERVILSTFAGCFAENHFREEQKYPLLDGPPFVLSCDWHEAASVLTLLS